jgi:DUF4097 and DUF4098 domain-containing protein YvlB
MELRVETIDSDQATLTVDLEFWSGSEEWMDLVEEEFDVTVDERSSVIDISGGRMPERDESWWRRVFGGSREVSYALDVVLRVPAGTELRLENRYGDIDVEDIVGALEVDNSSGEVRITNSGATTVANSYGPITVTNSGELRVRGSSSAVNVIGVTGDADIETSYDELVVEDVSGTLRAVASSGTLRATNIGGRADITNSYSPVEVRNVAELRLRSSSSKVTVTEVRGDADLTTSYDELTAETIGGLLEIDNSSGAVTVDDARSDVTVRNSYAPVRISNVTGSLIVDSSSSAVTVRDIEGDVEIATSYAGAEVRGAAGRVEVRNQSGRVNISDLRGAALTAEHTVRTSYANIELDWPSATPLAIDAECSYGRIRRAQPAVALSGWSPPAARSASPGASPTWRPPELTAGRS